MKIAEERSTFAVPLLQSEEIGVDRIGELARGAAGIHGVSRSVEDRAVLENEMIPRGLDSRRAGRRQRKILEVERREIALNFRSIAGGIAKRLEGAVLQSGRERCDAQSPPRSLRLPVEARAERRIQRQSSRRLWGHARLDIIRSNWHWCIV